jgi:type I restriction enzyme S subunit
MKYKRYPKYKDSGVEWIGEIPEGWEIKKIKFTSYVKGRIGWQGLTSQEYIEKGPYLITGTDFKDGIINWESCHHVEQWRYEQDPYIQIKNNDILITKDGTIGKIAFVEDVPGDTTLNSGVMVVRPLNNSILPKFQNWIFNSRLFTDFIEFIKSGTTINHLYQEEFGKFTFPVPPIDEQEKLYDFLQNETTQFDELIAKSKAQVTLLEEKRQATITQAVTKGLDPSVKMKDSGVEWIGEIPEHWEVKKLKFVTSCLDGKRIPLNGDERNPGIFPYYGASGIVDYIDDYIFDEKLVCLSEDGENLRSRQLPISFIIEGKTWVNNHAHVLKPINYNHSFLAYFLNSINITPFLEGATRSKLNQASMNNIFLTNPSLPEQQQIEDFLQKQTTQFDELIAKSKTQVTLLEEKRQALITATVTGKIDVRK